MEPVPLTSTKRLLHPVGDRERVGYGGIAKGAPGNNGYAIFITLSRRVEDHVALLTSALPQLDTHLEAQCVAA